MCLSQDRTNSAALSCGQTLYESFSIFMNIVSICQLLNMLVEHVFAALTLQLQVNQTGVECIDVITGVSLQQWVLHASVTNTVLSTIGRWYISSHGWVQTSTSCWWGASCKLLSTGGVQGKWVAGLGSGWNVAGRLRVNVVMLMRSDRCTRGGCAVDRRHSG